MASSALSPVMRTQSADGGTKSGQPSPDSYPVPPEWIIADPDENKRHILAMLEQGERDIAAGRGRDLEDVLRESDEIIAAAIVAQPSRR